MEEDIEMMVYQMLCKDCPNARRCHELCETCDEYEENLEELSKKEN